MRLRPIVPLVTHRNPFADSKISRPAHESPSPTRGAIWIMTVSHSQALKTLDVQIKSPFWPPPVCQKPSEGSFLFLPSCLQDSVNGHQRLQAPKATRIPVCAESGQLQDNSNERASLHDRLRVKSTLYPLGLSSRGACDKKDRNKYVGLPRCFSFRP